MMNKLLLTLAIFVFSTCILGSQTVITNTYDDYSTLYLIIPTNQLILSSITHSALYKISVTLIDSDNKPVFQQIENLELPEEILTRLDNTFLEFSIAIQPGQYKLITLLENSVLGDKKENHFSVSIPSTEQVFITNLVIAETNQIRFLPQTYENLNILLDKCHLVLNTYSECDSIVLNVQFQSGTQSYNIPKYSGYLFDLMPILKQGTVQGLVLNYYSGNIIDKYSKLLYKASDPYSLKYSLNDQLLQIKYIANQNEWKSIKKLAQKDPQRAVDYFWNLHQNSFSSKKNDLRDLFYQRVFKADELFTIHKKLPGWKSDRGRIYIIKGPPDDVVEDAFPIGAYPYIIWRYYRDNSLYKFEDKSGYGNYTLEVEYDEN